MSEATITYDDFAKVDIRVGTIVRAEIVPKSDKLLKLEVDFGEALGTRTVVAGIAQSYSLAHLVGTSGLFIVNLLPRKVMGIESHGMILAAEDTVGRVSMAKCVGCAPGAKVG